MIRRREQDNPWEGTSFLWSSKRQKTRDEIIAASDTGTSRAERDRRQQQYYPCLVAIRTRKPGPPTLSEFIIVLCIVSAAVMLGTCHPSRFTSHTTPPQTVHYDSRTDTLKQSSDRLTSKPFGIPSVTGKKLNDVASNIALQRSRHHPQMVQYDWRTNTAKPIQPKKASVTEFVDEDFVLTPNAQRLRDWKQLDREHIEQAVDGCKPMKEWMTHHHEFCNPIHEMDLAQLAIDDHLTYLARGGDRLVLKTTIERTPIILKVMIWKDRIDFSDDYLECQRKEGIITEHLSSSPYILSSYGYCGTDSLLELGNGGTLWDRFKRSRGGEEVGSIDKLKMAIQVLSGVADLHDSHVAHIDLNLEQFVFVDGVYKLSDFHIAQMMTWNATTGNICPQIPQQVYSAFFYRAPEDRKGVANDNIKSDDYMAGNILYSILSNEWIFEHEDLSEAERKATVRRGERPLLPRSVQGSYDRATRAMVEGIAMLWEHDIKKRATSRQVANFFLQKLEQIEGKAVEGAVPLDIPALPDDWDYVLDDDYW